MPANDSRSAAPAGVAKFRSTGRLGLWYRISSCFESSWQKVRAWLRLVNNEPSSCQLFTCWRTTRYSTYPFSVETSEFLMSDSFTHSLGRLCTYWDTASRKISSFSKLVSTLNLSVTYRTAGADRAPFIMREFAMEPFDRVATSPVNAKRTVVVSRSMSRTIQNAEPFMLDSEFTGCTVMLSPISYGRLQMMNNRPSTNLELACEIIKLNDRMTEERLPKTKIAL
mmetsp:Transcript_5398/g.13313  ORF Transcript_5398/g.13313 Transcript_5398/m.13313 type:complete len:225 (+) Transcript_5398:2254-2928(+)